ncbi:MAG: hypothetical protein ABI132_04225 [Rhodanobacteraceae bacterium]
MDPISQITNSLSPYFGATAQVSGSLVGLVFVALTFNIKALGLRGNPALRAFARQTLGDFLLVLVLSLSMLIPQMPRDNLGLVLAILGAVGMFEALRSLWIVRRAEGASAPRGLLVQRLGLSILGNLGVLSASVLLLIQSQNLSAIGSLLVSVPVILIISGCRSAWLLVLHAAD